MFSAAPAGLTEVDGLCRLSAGAATVVVSATGPIEPKIRQELPTKAALEIAIRPSAGVAGTREKALEDALRTVLQAVVITHSYPRQLIQIVVQFLSSDVDQDLAVAVSGERGGSGNHYLANDLCAALNAAYFALVDANIALSCSFAAVSYALTGSGELIESPSLPQMQAAASHHVVCFDVREGKASKLLLVDSNGSFTEDDVVTVIETASIACGKIHDDVQRPVVESTVQEAFKWAS